MTTRKALAKPPQRRVSAKVRRALEIRVHEGKAWREAAQAAGLSEAGIHKARRAAHVQQLLEEIKADYIQAVDDLKAPHKARAMEVARDLLDNSKSDAVKARMVEFLAGESKGQTINVGVSVGSGPPAQGYEYVHPSQEVVVIRGRSDNQSGAPTVDDADIIEQSPKRET